MGPQPRAQGGFVLLLLNSEDAGGEVQGKDGACAHPLDLPGFS